jgi:hypothetical protein
MKVRGQILYPANFIPGINNVGYLSCELQNFLTQRYKKNSINST